MAIRHEGTAGSPWSLPSPAPSTWPWLSRSCRAGGPACLPSPAPSRLCPVAQCQEVCVRATSFARAAPSESLLHWVTTQNNNSCHPLPELNNNGSALYPPGPL